MDIATRICGFYFNGFADCKVLFTPNIKCSKSAARNSLKISNSCIIYALPPNNKYIMEHDILQIHALILKSMG